MSIHSKVLKGSIVKVIAGNHKGSQGKVLSVKENIVRVEGVHLIKKHMKRSQNSPQGGIVEKEGPIHVSNVKVVNLSS